MSVSTHAVGRTLVVTIDRPPVNAIDVATSLAGVSDDHGFLTPTG